MILYLVFNVRNSGDHLKKNTSKQRNFNLKKCIFLKCMLTFMNHQKTLKSICNKLAFLHSRIYMFYK